MWSPLALTLACAVLVESRVRFTTSEVLDDIDLKGVNTAEFRCSAGCRVYSPTKNDNIVIIDAAFKEYKSLGDLANMAGQVYYLQPGQYKLSNKGMVTEPSFVFYAIESGAMNFNAKVVYVGAGKTTTIDSSSGQWITVMSSSAAVRFSSFLGDYSTVLPEVYATGSDSATASSRPVYSARSAATIARTGFPVNSPIATINFKSAAAGRSVVVSGDAGNVATGEDTSSVYVSPGYVGCEAVGDALYTNVPRVLSIDSSITLMNSDGLALNVDGKYKIANAADALLLSIDNNEQKYSGTGNISEKRDYTSKVNVRVQWSKKDGSKDNFAVQIDVPKKAGGTGPGPVATTKKTDPAGPGVVTTSPRPAVDPTTSGIQSITLFISSIVILLAIFSR